MSVFWNAVHTIRAGAYFKNALDNNSNQKAKDQYKKSHKISEKVLLSGIILATSALLLGRACYRAIKRHHKKRKVKKALQQQPIAPPANSGNAYHYTPDTYENRVKDAQKILAPSKPKDTTDDEVENVWGGDIPLTNQQWKDLRNLKLYKVDEKRNKVGTCCLVPISKHGSVFSTIYVNGSGIWQAPEADELKANNPKITKKELEEALKDRYQLLDNNEQDKVIKLTRLSQMMSMMKTAENYLPDLFKICDIIQFID